MLPRTNRSIADRAHADAATAILTGANLLRCSASAAERQDATYRVVLRVQPHLWTDSGRQLKDQLIAFVADESASARPGERLPGSSEILESAFGKLKSLEGDSQKGGFTSLLLGLGALVGHVDVETIRNALATVPWKQVRTWIEENLGQTFHAKRRLAYNA